jgi:tetratricopeptide (TPR) repeat protein
VKSKISILILIAISIFLAFKYPWILQLIYIGSIGIIAISYLFTSLLSLYTFATAKNINNNRSEALLSLVAVVASIIFSSLGVLMFYGAIRMSVKSNDLDNSAALKINKNDIAGALTDYNESIELAPKHAKTYYNRGNLKVDKLDDIQGALADYNKAIVLDIHYADAYNRRGILKKDKLNDIKGALADYHRAIELNPQYADAYYNRGILKKDPLNDKTGAIKDFQQAANLYQKQDDMSSYRDAIDRLKELGINK